MYGKYSATPLANLLHTSSTQDYSHLTRNSDGKFNCTLIPGDGVGPEMVNMLKSLVWKYKLHSLLN
jgi:hypothetical protein